MNRRRFLTGVSALGAAGALYYGRRKIQESHTSLHLAHPSLDVHAAVSSSPSAPARQLRTRVAIAGGGMSGLAAAWWLDRNGIHDWMLFELEEEIGGNATGGQSPLDGSGHPRGAHYVPLLRRDSFEANELFKDIGLIIGERQGRPIYAEEHLVTALSSRFFTGSDWHDGDWSPPADDRERQEYQAFLNKMEEMKSKRGRDGKPLFAIPIAHSSRDPSLEPLFQQSMASWLVQQGFRSAGLLAYINHCCRDDFGIPASRTPAYMGLHYFAARNGEGDGLASDTVITFPDGLASIVRRLRARLSGDLRPKSLVLRVEGGNPARMLVREANGQVLEVLADHAIVAMPAKAATRLSQIRAHVPVSHPWLVTALSLDADLDGSSMPLCWDNLWHSKNGLGYVNNRHTEVRRYPDRYADISHYMLFDDAEDDQINRRWMAAHMEDPAFWQGRVFADLALAHPAIDWPRATSWMECYLRPHGLASPELNRPWHTLACETAANVHYAHTDRSGYSVMEEAIYWGVEAARVVI